MKPKSNDIMAALATRWCADKGWLLLPEVADSPGFGGRRRLDAIAIGVWGSNSMHTIGIEVKVTRGDFMRELDQPHKRKEFRDQLCEFYMAVPAKLVSKDEVPEDCGLLELRGDRLVAVKRSPQRRRMPDSDLCATMFRAALRQVSEARSKVARVSEFAGRTIGVDDLMKLGRLYGDHKYQQLRRELEHERQQRHIRKEASVAWRKAMLAVEEFGRQVGSYNDTPAEKAEKVVAICKELSRRVRLDDACAHLQTALDSIRGTT